MRRHPVCVLVGHTGESTESGFHVCSRCGLHEYHCHEDYQRSAVLLIPWHWLCRKARRVREAIASALRRPPAETDVPF